MKPSTGTYRPDIDGLRAVAVILVLLWHLDVGWLSGGFVGVDVFFVISGYLITRLITNEINNTGSFSLPRFYLRRLRRLYPALLATLGASFVAGAILLSPSDLQRFSGATLAAAFSLSNLYFWRESGYFDLSAESKPLLHTWSLGVEEQFYLLWPWLLVLLALPRPKWVTPIGLLATGVASLYAIRFLSPDAAFFLTPFRAFEFVIGGLLVWTKPATGKLRPAAELALPLGIVMILLAATSFDGNTDFPGINTLLPCIGAALIIWASNPPYLGRVLNNRLFVGIGLISYSMYLVHWPLITFWKYYTLSDLSVVDKSILALGTVLLSILSYRWIELPFRRKPQHIKANSRFLFAITMGSLIIALPSAHAWKTAGWAWRLPPEINESVEDMRARRAEYWGDWKVGVDSVEDFSTEKLSVLVIGDSLALDVANMLVDRPGIEVHYLGTSYKCKSFTRPRDPKDAKMAAHCPKNISRFQNAYPTVDVVVLADQFSTWAPDLEIIRNINVLRNAGYYGPLLIYGERPIYNEIPANLVLKHGRLQSAGKFTSEHLLYSPKEMREAVDRAKKYYENKGIGYYSPVEALCPSETWCDILTQTNKVIYFDTKHFTLDGVKMVAPDFIDYLGNFVSSNKTASS
ncbi:MAG: acyltransferase family protein [Halieaceae bacterium]